MKYAILEKTQQRNSAQQRKHKTQLLTVNITATREGGKKMQSLSFICLPVQKM